MMHTMTGECPRCRERDRQSRLDDVTGLLADTLNLASTRDLSGVDPEEERLARVQMQSAAEALDLDRLVGACNDYARLIGAPCEEPAEMPF